MTKRPYFLLAVSRGGCESTSRAWGHLHPLRGARAPVLPPLVYEGPGPITECAGPLGSALEENLSPPRPGSAAEQRAPAGRPPARSPLPDSDTMCLMRAHVESGQRV